MWYRKRVRKGHAAVSLPLKEGLPTTPTQLHAAEAPQPQPSRPKNATHNAVRTSNYNDRWSFLASRERQPQKEFTHKVNCYSLFSLRDGMCARGLNRYRQLSPLDCSAETATTKKPTREMRTVRFDATKLPTFNRRHQNLTRELEPTIQGRVEGTLCHKKEHIGSTKRRQRVKAQARDIRT